MARALVDGDLQGQSESLPARWEVAYDMKVPCGLCRRRVPVYVDHRDRQRKLRAHKHPKTRQWCDAGRRPATTAA